MQNDIHLRFVIILVASALILSCSNGSTKNMTVVQLFDRIQGKVKMNPGEALSAFYSDQVTFIRVAPKPRVWETFPDVRLRRNTIFDDWLLDSQYLNRSILPKLRATNIEVALPSAGVVEDSPGSLRGSYQRKTRIRALVRKRVVVVDLEHPRVMRTTRDEPWSLDWSALTNRLGSRPQAVFIVFPISD